MTVPKVVGILPQVITPRRINRGYQRFSKHTFGTLGKEERPEGLGADEECSWQEPFGTV